MTRLEMLHGKVAGLYNAKDPNRADWADWIYQGHVLLVANAARDIANRFGANSELAEGAGLLHDVADAVMKREDPRHTARSLELARELLTETGFNEREIDIIVNDAIAKHGCHGDMRPSTPEGKVMAAADAVVHLRSDFYMIAETRRAIFQSVGEITAWALPKIERDFTNKIAFDDLREEVRADYERLKLYFQ